MRGIPALIATQRWQTTNKHKVKNKNTKNKQKTDTLLDLSIELINLEKMGAKEEEERRKEKKEEWERRQKRAQGFRARLPDCAHCDKTTLPARRCCHAEVDRVWNEMNSEDDYDLLRDVKEMLRKCGIKIDRLTAERNQRRTKECGKGRPGSVPSGTVRGLGIGDGLTSRRHTTRRRNPRDDE